MRFFKKEQAETIWGKYKGNTNEVLLKKAKLLAMLLVEITTEDIQFFFEELRKDKQRRVDESKSKEVFFEMVIFYIHLIDRISFAQLEAEKRNAFMNTLFVEVQKELSRIQDIKNEHFLNAFDDFYNLRQIEYGQYRLIPEHGEGAKGTLTWELGKKVAGILGNERDPEIIMIIKVFITYAMKQMDLSNLFK